MPKKNMLKSKSSDLTNLKCLANKLRSIYKNKKTIREMPEEIKASRITHLFSKFGPKQVPKILGLHKEEVH
jgi:hypothetical protein